MQPREARRAVRRDIRYRKTHRHHQENPMPSLVDITNAYRFTPAGDLAGAICQIATDRARDYDVRDRYDAAAQRALRRLVAFATSPNHLVVLTIGLDEELALAAVAEVATCCIDLAAEELSRDGHIQVSEDGRVLTFDIFADAPH